MINRQCVVLLLVGYIVLCGGYRSIRDFSSSCTIPNHPANGQLIDNQGNPVTPGNIVKRGTVIGVICKKYFSLDPQDKKDVTCDTTWSKLPACLKTCISAIPKSGSNLVVHCSFHGNPVNCETPVDGTQASYTCSGQDSLNNAEQRFCIDGSWDYYQPRCSLIP